MDKAKQIGMKIRELRKRMKLTQSELAGTDFTKSFISQVEKGATRPSLKSLEIIAARLGQPVSYFLDESPEGTSLAASDPTSDSYLETGKQLQLNGQFAEALDCYQKALTKCHPAEYRKKGEIWLYIGHVYFKQEQYAKARDHFALAREQFARARDSEYLARCLNDLGTVQVRLGEDEAALESYREALRIIESDPIANPSYRLTILTNLANTLARLKKYDSAFNLLKGALSDTETPNDHSHGRYCDVMGYVCASLGNFDEAISWTTRALDYFRSVGNAWFEFVSLNNLSSYLRQIGDLKRSRQMALEAFNLAKRSGNAVQLAAAHACLAELAVVEGDAAAAYQHLIEAFTLAPEYEGAGQWTATVVKCAEQAPVPTELLALMERLATKWKGNRRVLAEVHSNLGKLYNLMGDAEKANRHLSKSVDLFRNA